MHTKLCGIVITSYDEIDEFARFYNQNCNFGVVYALPQLINAVVVFRAHINKRFKIYSTIDYPDGKNNGIDKFKGLNVDVFMVDGYDVVLGPNHSSGSVAAETSNIVSFIRKMVNPVTEVCFTINRSKLCDDKTRAYAAAIEKSAANKIKLEASTNVQSSKACFKSHLDTINIIREVCGTPIAVCGNVNKKIYDEINAGEMVFSVKQYIAFVKSCQQASHINGA